MNQAEGLFAIDGGRVGALMRAHDWSRSPLGHPAGWPQSLRTIVSLLLQSQFPMFVAWGKRSRLPLQRSVRGDPRRQAPGRAGAALLRHLVGDLARYQPAD